MAAQARAQAILDHIPADLVPAKQADVDSAQQALTNAQAQASATGECKVRGERCLAREADVRVAENALTAVGRRKALTDNRDQARVDLAKAKVDVEAAPKIGDADPGATLDQALVRKLTGVKLSDRTARYVRVLGLGFFPVLGAFFMFVAGVLSMPASAARRR